MNSPGISGRIAAAFLESKLTPILVISALALGVFAVLATPREEEPQIVVPMIDIGIGWPGAGASDVERLVAVPLERSIRRIPEVEYVYVTSRPSGALIIVRFYVNSDPERALVNVRARVADALPGLPPGATAPEITERSIDDVPIFAATFSSDTYDPMTLRRIASEVEEDIRRVPHVAQTTLMGGLRREIRVELDLDALAARDIPPPWSRRPSARRGFRSPRGRSAPAGSRRSSRGASRCARPRRSAPSSSPRRTGRRSGCATWRG